MIQLHYYSWASVHTKKPIQSTPGTLAHQCLLALFSQYQGKEPGHPWLHGKGNVVHRYYGIVFSHEE